MSFRPFRPRRPAWPFWMLAAALPALWAPGATAADNQFKAWRLTCPETANGRTCVIYTQTGGATRIGNVAVRVSVGRRSDNQAVAVVDISMPAMKERGFGIGVDRNAPLIATIEQCDQQACRAVVTGAAAEALIEQFKLGHEAVVTYFAGPRTPVRAHILLDGFTAAYNNLRRASG